MYINQLVSASLASPRVGLLVNQTASLYGPNFTATANITFSRLATGQVHCQPELVQTRNLQSFCKLSAQRIGEEAYAVVSPCRSRQGSCS